MTPRTCPDCPPQSSIFSAKWETLKKQSFNKRSYSPVRTITASARAVSEGSGGSGGIVLPMTLTYGGQNSVSYVIQPGFGTSDQLLPLQVDTGSSDLWVASTSCAGSTCGTANGKLYNPSSSTPTGDTFNISYLVGQATGVIVWDRVKLGGYQIGNQALGAVDSVANEPLDAFSGVLGLALPRSSIISSQIPPSTNDSPDGAIFASNLFTIGNGAPASRFISLSLERPGSSRVPSMFGIGRHPSAVVSDPSIIQYSSLFDDGQSPLFWKTTISAITVYVNGARRDVLLTSAFPGSVLPTAVLDTGVPFILATTAIANGIYGALGIGPAADGNFYVPCTTPLNMTIVVNGVTIPLHPLDLTQPNGQGSTSCTGLIQNADVALRQSNIGDLVLGVPFMRSIYTVLAFTPPHPNGTFDPYTASSGVESIINPRLGMLSLINSTIALEEFYDVRVLGKPLSTPSAKSGTTASHSGLSVGIQVLIGLVSGFTALGVAVFLGRFLYQRRNWKKKSNIAPSVNTSLDEEKNGLEMSVLEDTGTKETSPEKKHSEELTKRMTSSGNTIDSVRTKVEEGHDDEMMMDEFGLVYFGRRTYHRSHSSESSGRRDTLVWDESTNRNSGRSAVTPIFDDLDSRIVTPSGALQASDHPLTNQPENLGEAGFHPENVEFPTTENDAQDMDQQLDSMAGIGTRHFRRLTSDDFSIAETARLSNHGLMFPPIQPTHSAKSDSLRTGLDTQENNVPDTNTPPFVDGSPP